MYNCNESDSDGRSSRNIKDLSPELIEKAKGCESPDELVTLAKTEGVQLTDEELDMISGGSTWYDENVCPVLGKHNWQRTGNQTVSEDGSIQQYEYKCACGDTKWLSE